MSDIFISYSSRDREQAELLTELLASAGLSVWIDQSGIGAATSWSGEISKAITDCKALIVLLSPSSVDSKNVTREVALAFERNKKILPIDLEPVTLPDDFAYHLAGIQRAPMTNIDAVIRALAKLGLEATGAPQAPKIVKETDGRKSLMILPFEDLSPTGDNQWFADGIVSELITALTNVKSLRMMDAATTKEYKSYKGHLTSYAKEMSIRYFVQGDVRKFGDNIKITARLLDIDSGDYLWQDSMKGTMNDIFEIQESVALKVVEGLKVHLATGEKKKVAERGTENAEAYELTLRASEYFNRQTKEGYQLSAQLLTEAIRLDPSFAQAYQSKASALAALCARYVHDPRLLDEAESLSKEALRLKPDLFAAYTSLSLIYLNRGMLAQAEEAAKEYIRKDPESSNGHFALGFYYSSTKQYAKAIAPCEESVRLKPNNTVALLNLVIACYYAGEQEKCSYWATQALPHSERHLKLHPDDERARVDNASLLFFAGKIEEAHAAANQLMTLKDGNSLYNTACILGMLGEKSNALVTFRNALEKGYRNIPQLKEFLTDEKEGIAALAGTPEYEEVKRMVEKIEAQSVLGTGK